MATTIEILREAAQRTDARANAALEAFTAEMSKYSDDNLPTEEGAAHIDDLRGAFTSAKVEASRASEDLEAAQKWDEQTRDHAKRNGNGRPPTEPSAEPSRGRQGYQSIGARFAHGEDYQGWIKAMAPSGQFPRNMHLNSPPLHFGGFSELDRHADLLTGSDQTSAGALIIPDQYGPITEFGRRPLVMRDVITNLTTDSDSVEFVRITDEDNNAAPVPESNVTDSDTSGGEPGFKPESAMAFERVSTPVKTIAHWIPATTRALSDASQLRGLIDSFLRDGVAQVLEDQIVTGDGLGENLEGFAETSGIQSQAFVTNVFTTTRQARRKVRTVGRRMPSAFVFHPVDWENIELQQDGNDRYYYAGPLGMGPSTLWGLPVIESEAVPEGTGFVADWSTCVLWDRMQASISVSNSHADFFIRNLVAVLCELRAAFGVLKPNAIVSIDMAAS